MADSKNNPVYREYERIPKKVNVTLLQPDSDLSRENKGKKAFTENIAEKGICVCVPASMETGTTLSLRIDLEGWQKYLRTVLSLPENESDISPLTVRGEVIWAHELPDNEGYQVGIQFKDFDEKLFKAYRKYLHIIRETVR